MAGSSTARAGWAATRAGAATGGKFKFSEIMQNLLGPIDDLTIAIVTIYILLSGFITFTWSGREIKTDSNNLF